MENNIEKILKKLTSLERRVDKLEFYNNLSPMRDKAEVDRNEIIIPPEPSNVSSDTATEKKMPEFKKDFTEARIGREWFNKIGAVSIIIGVVLFISYTFQYLGPVGKISIGYIASFLLIALGLFFSKKYKNYASGILAVGWAILYFTTYATYYIEASQIIFNANTNLLLLFMVAGALAIFSYFYESEYFSIMALILGALSAIISQALYISLLAIAILIIYAVIMTIAKSWARLGYLSVIVSYLTYWIVTVKQGVFDSYGFFQIGSLFLIIYFLMFVVASFAVHSSKYKENQYIPSIIFINTFAFFWLFISQLYEFFPETDGYFSGLLGIFLLLAAGIAYDYAKEKKYLYATYAWLGWGFATLAIPLQLSGSWIAGAWVVEGAALFLIGLFRNKKSFIITGAMTLTLFLIRFLSFDLLKTDSVNILGFDIKLRTIFSLYTILIFSSIAFIWDRLKEKIDKEFNTVIFLPTYVATGILILATILDGNRNFVSLLLLVEGFLIFMGGLFGKRDYLRMAGLFPLIGFALTWLSIDLLNTNPVEFNFFGDLNYRTVNSLLGVIIFYILYSMGLSFFTYLKKEEKNIIDYFAIMASVILVALAYAEAGEKFITVAWSIEGTLILLAGFAFKKRVLRLSGMIILLLAILRIFIIDLSFLETIYRIISFIVLGVILMGISFIYTKYKDKLL